jgi:NAD+ synthase
MREARIGVAELRRALVDFDREETTTEIVEFIGNIVSASKAEGVVVGLSGGVDSTLTVTLCVKALGNDRVLGVLMPLDFTPTQDMDDAAELAQILGIRTETVSIQGITEAFCNALKVNSDQKLPLMNIRCRTRMIVLYYYANLHHYLVAGTGDKSEDLIGFFTKYGDGAADFFLINHLYKTQVRILAEYLGVPRRMAHKPSSPQLYPGHKATDEIPVDYDTLDLILVSMFEKKMKIDEVSRVTHTPLERVKQIWARFKESHHKRTYPPMIQPWDF